MTKDTKYALYALGGVAALTAAGVGIYYATKKPTLGGGGGGGGGSSGGGTTQGNGSSAKPAPSYQANALPLELQSFAQWVATHSQLINPITGNAE